MITTGLERQFSVERQNLRCAHAVVLGLMQEHFGALDITSLQRNASGQQEQLAALARFGYDTADPHAAIAAFQRRFRQSRVDGLPDRETAERLAGLLRAAGDDAPFA